MAHNRTALPVAGLAFLVALAGLQGRTPPTSRADVVSITSPAFASGGPIPVQYSCTGANIAPPLAWSLPSSGALVVDDPDAVHGTFIHWIVTGIGAGTGSTVDGQTPGGATSLANSDGKTGYTGPCPPAGTGVHHYRFTLYQLSAPIAAGLGGAQAVQAITAASAGQAQLVGTFEHA